MKQNSIKTENLSYGDFLDGLKQRVASSRYKAALSVNRRRFKCETHHPDILLKTLRVRKNH